MLKSFFAVVLISALAWAALAHAQPAGRGGRGPTATLYEGDNFQGRQVTISGPVGNLSDYAFNDRAHSLRLQGRWRLCEHADFGGRCVELTGEVPELNTVVMAERITSLTPVGGGYGGGPPPRRDDDDYGRPGGGYGRGSAGVEGTRTVFFARPTVRGLDLAAGSNGANTYCRNQGLGAAVYWDGNERAGRAIGPDGQVVGSSPIIRDLLCRKF